MRPTGWGGGRMETRPGLSGRWRALLPRLAPLLVIALLQVVIVTRPAHKARVKTTNAAGAPSASSDATGAAVAGEPGGSTSAGPGGSAAAAAAGTGSTGAAATGAPAAGATRAAAGATAGAAATNAATGAAQAVDALGRPTSGDKSRCAPGALVQENVTRYPLPCI